MTLPIVDAPCAWRDHGVAAQPGPQGPDLRGRLQPEGPRHLPVLAGVLAQLAPAPRGLVAGLVALFTGTLDRDRVFDQYLVYCETATLGDPSERRRALRELRASLERFQDACSADDYLKVQQAYPEIDAVLAGLQAQLEAPA